MSGTIDLITEQFDRLELWQSSKVLQRSEYLVLADQLDTHIYLVKEGALRIYVTDEEQELTIRLAYGGDLVVALDSFLIGRPTVLYIQALRQSEVRVMSRDRFDEWINSDIAHLRLWNQLQGLMLVDQLERERDILTSSPVDRYNRVLARSPRLFQEVPRKYIASYLRMTPETLSRIEKS